MKTLLNLTLLISISLLTVFSSNAAISSYSYRLTESHNDSIVKSKQLDSEFYTKATFAATFSKASNVTDSIVDLAWSYYLDENWSRLNTLFVSNNIVSGGLIWPPANGGYNTVGNVHFYAGQMYDRYGFTYPANYASGVPNLSGSFTSPILDGKSFTFAQRALHGTEKDYDFYYTIEILQDLQFTCQEATAIPWFNQPGGATQEMWTIPNDPNTGYPYSFTQLAEMGLIRITIKASPSGKYPQLVGTVIGNKPVENQSFDSNFYTKATFAATFSKAKNLTDSIVDLAWTYYLDENWSRLNALFVSNKIEQNGVIWPPANGGFNTVDSVRLLAGQVYDRYGNTYPTNYTKGVPNLAGSFTSPVINGKPFTFGQRALQGTEEDYDFYYTIEILKDLDFTCQEATAIPWFNLPGEATQEMWYIPKDPNTGYPYSFTQLAEMGLIRITIKASPSGKYPNLVGTVIEKKTKKKKK